MKAPAQALYRAGQTVRVSQGMRGGPRGADRYVILRAMPEDGGGISYRVSDPTGGCDRIVSEFQIAPVADDEIAKVFGARR